MKDAEFYRRFGSIFETLSILRCRDHRRDANLHRARMLRDFASEAIVLADQLAPDGTHSITPAQMAAALGACRSIRFAFKNAARFGGEWNLNDLIAADRLARQAIGESGDAALKAKVPVITKRSLAAHKANWTRAKKGGAS